MTVPDLCTAWAGFWKSHKIKSLRPPLYRGVNKLIRSPSPSLLLTKPLTSNSPWKDDWEPFIASRMKDPWIPMREETH